VLIGAYVLENGRNSAFRTASVVLSLWRILDQRSFFPLSFVLRNLKKYPTNPEECGLKCVRKYFPRKKQPECQKKEESSGQAQGKTKLVE